MATTDHTEQKRRDPEAELREWFRTTENYLPDRVDLLLSIVNQLAETANAKLSRAFDMATPEVIHALRLGLGLLGHQLTKLPEHHHAAFATELHRFGLQIAVLASEAISREPERNSSYYWDQVLRPIEQVISLLDESIRTFAQMMRDRKLTVPLTDYGPGLRTQLANAYTRRAQIADAQAKIARKEAGIVEPTAAKPA